MPFVQGALGANSGPTTSVSSATATFGSAVGSGNTILVAIGGYLTAGVVTGASVADDKSNSYTQLQARTDGGAEVTIYVFAAINVTNGPTALTFTAGGATTLLNCQALGQEYSSVGPVNGSLANSQFTPGTTANVITTGNLTTTVNGCTIWGVSINGSTSPNNTTAVGAGFTQRTKDPTDGDIGFISEDRVQSTAGAIAATFTDATSGGTNRYATCVVALAPPYVPYDPWPQWAPLLAG
jgi:hypothetical protein